MKIERIKQTIGLLTILALIGVSLKLQVNAQQAQTATLVQQTSSHADAAIMAGTSATSSGTISFPAIGNLYFYITAVDITNCAGTSAAGATPTTLTLSNVTTTTGGLLTWTLGSGATAGSCLPTININFGPGGLKTAIPGTITTLTLPAFATQQTIRVNAYGYYAQ